MLLVKIAGKHEIQILRTHHLHGWEKLLAITIVNVSQSNRNAKNEHKTRLIPCNEISHKIFRPPHQEWENEEKNVDKQKTAKNHTINSNNLEKYFIASR